MKIAIGKELVDLDGRVLHDERGVITIRRLIIIYTGSYVAENAEDAIMANNIALNAHKLDQPKDVIDLTDEEYQLLLKSIEKPKHTSLVYVQLIKAIKK